MLSGIGFVGASWGSIAVSDAEDVGFEKRSLCQCLLRSWKVSKSRADDQLRR